MSIYLAEGDEHEEVEQAVERWLTTANLAIAVRYDAIIGSWFRRLEAKMSKAARSPAAREALLTAWLIAI